MAITLGSLKRNIRNIEAEFGGEKIKFSYKPGLITPAFGQVLNELEPKKSQVVEFLKTVMVSWDIEDDTQPADQEGHYPTLALTEKNLADMPSPVLVAIQNAIQNDLASSSKKS